MSRAGLRQAAGERADEVGLGEVLRVHRQHRITWHVVLTGVGLTLMGVVAAIVLAARRSPLWGLPLLLVAACWVVIIVAAHTGRKPARRENLYWFAVAERGVLFWRRDVRVATPMLWSDLTVVRSPTAVLLRWSDPDHGGHLYTVGVCGAGDLIRAVELGRPNPAWTVRRAVGPVIGVVALALVAWLAGVPVAGYVILGERPAELDDFARVCNDGGSFGGTAEYAGHGRHPLVLFERDADDPRYSTVATYAGGGARDSAAAAVQLVACSHYVGRASPTVLQTCYYYGGYTRSTYQGRWRVDVYQARTGTRVTSRMMVGTRHTYSCISVIAVPHHSSRAPAIYTDPKYGAALARLIGS